MNKKFLSGLWLFLLVFVLSGCTETKYLFEINGRDDIVISQTTTVNLNQLSELNSEFDFDQNRIIKKYQEDYKKKGYTVQPFEDDEKKGCKIFNKATKLKFFKPENLPAGFILAQESDTPFQVTKSPFRTKYYIHMTFDPGKIDGMPKQVAMGRAKVRKKPSQQVQVSKAAKLPDEEGGRKIKTRKRGGDSEDVQEDNIEEHENIDGSVENLSSENEDSQDEQQEEISPEPQRYVSPNDVFVFQTMDKIPVELRPKFELTIKLPKRASENNADKVVNIREYKWELQPDRTKEIVLKYETWNVWSFLFLIIVIYGTIYLYSMNKQFVVKKEDSDNKNAF